MNSFSVTDAHSGIDAIKIGDKLNFLRKENGLSQANLAEMLDVSTRTISNWEQGHKLFSLEHLANLSIIYGVKTDDILCLNAEDVVRLNSFIIIHTYYSSDRFHLQQL